MGQLKLERLYTVYHELKMEEEEIIATYVLELKGDKNKEVAAIAQAKFITDHNETYLALAKASLEYNVEQIRENHKRDKFYETMADAAQVNIDREKKYLEEAKSWAAKEQARLDKGKEDK